jgi:hypothetical protein
MKFELNLRKQNSNRSSEFEFKTGIEIELVKPKLKSENKFSKKLYLNRETVKTTLFICGFCVKKTISRNNRQGHRRQSPRLRLRQPTFHN